MSTVTLIILANNPNTVSSYLEYGLMMRAIQGRSWVLEAFSVSLNCSHGSSGSGSGSFDTAVGVDIGVVNMFVVPSGSLILSVMSTCPTVSVNFNIPTASQPRGKPFTYAADAKGSQGSMQLFAAYPGSTQWEKLPHYQNDLIEKSLDLTEAEQKSNFEVKSEQQPEASFTAGPGHQNKRRKGKKIGYDYSVLIQPHRGFAMVRVELKS